MSVAAPALGSSFADAMIRHAVKSVEAAEYLAEPFPHIFFRDFFSEDVYRTILSSFPPEADFARLTGDATRQALRLYGEHVAGIDPDVRDLWAAVSAMLTSPELEKAVRARLADGLEIRRKGDRIERLDQLRTVPRPVIYKDNDGYQIKPHPDTRRKVITMQLYCPPDERQVELGTTLYKASLKGVLNPGAYFLEPVKTFPFVPNVGYAFVVLKAYHTLTRMSWHGRPRIDVPVDRPRMSILNTFYTGEEFAF